MPGVAVDAQDQVWVFTRFVPPIPVYSAEGRLVHAWGADSIGSAHHIKIDREGNIWLADIGLHVVRKYSPYGDILLTIGTPGEPGNDKTHLDNPTDMAIAANGDVFVSDGYGNTRVVIFDAGGRFVRAWGQLGNGQQDFSLLYATAMDSAGRLYVADKTARGCRPTVRRGRCWIRGLM